MASNISRHLFDAFNFKLKVGLAEEDYISNNVIKHAGKKPTPVQKKCCGDYPNMKVYSPDRQTCCADGRLRSYGSC